MRTEKVKINYLYNSGFIMETEKNIVVFDYCGNSLSRDNSGKESEAIIKALSSPKHMLVLASHSHLDHFNAVVLQWSKQRSNIQYVLSSDIKAYSDENNICFISPYEEKEFENIKIKAYGSTDLGVSFLLRIDGLTIFHAGDLNWWNWWDESDEYNTSMEASFKEEVRRISEDNTHNNIDVSFFPVDPRLKESFSLGGEYFIKNTGTRVFIPMHFGEEYKITKEFSELMNKNKCEKGIRIVEITGKLQEILL